ncbi:unnamed protein product [Adineta steineri]|uniref:Uncharacterized protein n=1 Tax=Adineta steineri TaxID=433720 RepID=A0A815B6U0_9BILA|nr:unnamed protein product [Adineta steineri]
MTAKICNIKRSKCCSKQCLIGLGIGLLIGIILIVAIAVPVGIITRKCGLGTVSSTPNWIGTYQMDNACDTSICCCYTNQVFFSQITSNQLQISGSVTGACTGSSSTATLTLSMPSTFQTLLIWSTETIRLQLGQDNSYISFVNTARGSCSTSGMRTSYNTGIFTKRSLIIQSDFYLGKKMKLLNDNKQFQKTLELFDQYKKNKSETFSSMIITEALKACTHLKDLQRAETIHHLISSHIEDDSYISTSLIHLYNAYLLTSLLDAFMKCGDIKNAELLFNRISKKVLPTYGAMMKGYIESNQPNKVIDLFNTIQNPSEVNIIISFNACAQLGTEKVLNLVKKNALMTCGDISYAELLFNSSITKDSEIYGAMMKGLLIPSTIRYDIR